MNDLKTAKLERFMGDMAMSTAVFEVLMDSFTKVRPRAELGDTEEKSARFIAIQLIQESWKDLEKYKSVKRQETELTSNIGL